MHIIPVTRLEFHTDIISIRGCNEQICSCTNMSEGATVCTRIVFGLGGGGGEWAPCGHVVAMVNGNGEEFAFS